MTRFVVRLLPLAVAALALGCTTERETILPWLLVKKTTVSMGGFGNSSHMSYFVKHYGFWRKLDAWAAWVIDDGRALLNDEEGWAILRRGSLRPVHVCRPYESLTVPPLPGRFDCSERAPDANGPLTRVRAVRFDLSGRIVEDWRLSAVGEGRIFHASPRIVFYDDEGTPYFVIMDGEAATTCWDRPCGCALLSPGNDGARVVEGPTLKGADCHRRESWEPLVGRRLRDGWVGLRQVTPSAG
jgi:hypothetical protein